MKKIKTFESDHLESVESAINTFSKELSNGLFDKIIDIDIYPVVKPVSVSLAETGGYASRKEVYNSKVSYFGKVVYNED